MASKQTIDFSVPNPLATPNYSLPLYQYCNYEPTFNCWSIRHVGGYFKFNLSLPQKQGVNLIFRLCSAEAYGATSCPINITVNGQLLVENFDPHITNFYDMVWSVPANMLNQGDNEIKLILAGGKTKVFMSMAIVDIYDSPYSRNNWMSTIEGSVLISEISIPGTHDAAAINSTIHTPYACHNQSISEQLIGGIRILDVRLKIQKNGSTFSFVTCHGNLGSSPGINEYQSFPSLLDECKNFLAHNNTETVIMTLKIDDWNGYDKGNNRINALNALETLLNTYPITTSSGIPQIGSIRSKIFLYNRINDELRFGTPISWSDNTSGSYANSSGYRNYNLYVQDKYQDLPTFGSVDAKLQLVTAAFNQKRTGEVLLNFASATWYGVIGVYIMGPLLGYFGANAAPDRLRNFGWIMLDYEFEQYSTNVYGWVNIVDFIISSNFNYSGFEGQFTVVGHDEL